MFVLSENILLAWVLWPPRYSLSSERHHTPSQLYIYIYICDGWTVPHLLNSSQFVEPTLLSTSPTWNVASLGVHCSLCVGNTCCLLLFCGHWGTEFCWTSCIVADFSQWNRIIILSIHHSTWAKHLLIQESLRMRDQIWEVVHHLK